MITRRRLFAMLAAAPAAAVTAFHLEPSAVADNVVAGEPFVISAARSVAGEVADIKLGLYLDADGNVPAPNHPFADMLNGHLGPNETYPFWVRTCRGGDQVDDLYAIRFRGRAS